MKELVLIDMHAKTRVADLRIRSLPYLRADIAMYDLLKLFQTGRSHMVVLTKPPAAADGTVSRANSTDVTVQIEEAKDRVSPEVRQLTADLFVAAMFVRSYSCLLCPQGNDHGLDFTWLFLCQVFVVTMFSCGFSCGKSLLDKSHCATNCLESLAL